ncbi:hypothetical protein SDC9_158060 [bioreactor metagenome]|uniref:Uncharacterized protein n=1 Tax=bioreactor metagenome TaxID=1076179 RepID=A0A645FEE9_9ZZZZ
MHISISYVKTKSIVFWYNVVERRRTHVRTIRGGSKNDRLGGNSFGGRDVAAGHGAASWLFALLLLQPVPCCCGCDTKNLCRRTPAVPGSTGYPRHTGTHHRHCHEIWFFFTTGSDESLCIGLPLYTGGIPQKPFARSLSQQKRRSLSRIL